MPATAKREEGTLPEEEQVRARVYALLGALLMAPPGGELLARLAEIDGDPADEAGMAGAWWALREAARTSDPAAVSQEHHALFIGLGRGELVPHGSFYLAGFLMEAPLARLRADLAALGLERREEIKEPEDHAGALCDTMALLITREPPLAPARQYRFFSEHLEPWMGRFFQDLRAAESASFYRAVGRLGEHFIDIERQYVAMSRE
jgi:TorA maturation chaperone TorD